MRSTTKYDYKRIFRLQSGGGCWHDLGDRWRLMVSGSRQW